MPSQLRAVPHQSGIVPVNLMRVDLVRVDLVRVDLMRRNDEETF